MRTSTPGSLRIRRSGSDSRSRREPRPQRRLADEHIGGAAFGGDGGRDVGDVVALLDQHPGAEHGGEAPERPELLALLGSPAPSRAGRRRAGRARRRGAAPSARRGGRALRARPRRHQGQHPLGDRLRRRFDQLLAGADRLLGPPWPGLRLDLLRGLAQRELAQGGQVLDPEEVVERGVDPLGRVDLARPQALDQRLGREVDQHHLVGGGEHGVGEGLAHADAGELGNAVVEALEMLDVDGRIHVDPGLEHVVDVLVALRVLEARRVGVRELVDQRQLGRPLEDRRQVHLLEHRVAVGHPPARQPLEPLRLRLGLGAAVGLEVGDHHVAPGPLLGLSLLQHAVGLADPRRHAEEDLVAAASTARHAAGILLAQAPSTLWTSRSMSLIPMNGATIPPRP